MKVWVVETYQPYSGDYWSLEKIFRTFESAEEYAKAEFGGTSIRYSITEWEVQGE